jgi:hypothetical protein
LYDVELEIYFDAVKEAEPDTKCQGKLKIHEFNQDDDELSLEIT